MNLSSARLPRLYNYEQAKAHHDSVVPFRSGNNKAKRPLGARRYDYCLIEHYPETNAVALQMYGSDVVTWFPNGEAHVSLCKYDTIGTRQFIYATTTDIRHERGVTYLYVGDATEGGWYAFADSETPLILKDGKVMNPVQTYTYKPRRDVMKALHKRYGGFREYVKTMGLVMTGLTDKEVEEVSVHLPKYENQRFIKLTLPIARNRYYHGTIKPKENLAEFLRNIEKAQATEDLHAYYHLFVHLGVSALAYNSYTHTYTVAWANNAGEIGKTLLEYFDEIIKHIHKEEVFTKVEVPIGTRSTNVNRKYFN